MIIQILLGLMFAFSISWAGWQTQALTKRGMWTASLIGGLIFAFGYLPWSILILAFFISSSLLSRIPGKDPDGSDSKGAKLGPRDWTQVLANGGWGAVLVLIPFFQPRQTWAFIAYAGAMAAITADTWATEIGKLSRQKPRIITTGRLVEPGTSGGITTAGSLSSLAGSTFVAFLSLLISPLVQSWMDMIIITIAGMLGSVFDSLLGASIQVMYACPRCKTETEQHPLHNCQTPTTYSRGWRWLNNDGVNFLSSVLGSLISLTFWLLSSP